jgi:hypothetical protein
MQKNSFRHELICMYNTKRRKIPSNFDLNKICPVFFRHAMNDHVKCFCRLLTSLRTNVNKIIIKTTKIPNA